MARTRGAITYPSTMISYSQVFLGDTVEIVVL
jgi:hypothetical protein